jgi:hypothetical protein
MQQYARGDSTLCIHHASIQTNRGIAGKFDAAHVMLRGMLLFL